jgi:hypothetical protein
MERRREDGMQRTTDGEVKQQTKCALHAEYSRQRVHCRGQQTDDKWSTVEDSRQRVHCRGQQTYNELQRKQCRRQQTEHEVLGQEVEDATDSVCIADDREQRMQCIGQHKDEENS